MYLVRRIFALMLCVDLPLATAAEAQSDSRPAAPATSAPTASTPPLLADCIEKRLLTSSPPERKAAPRPKRHVRHGVAKKIAHKKPAPRRHAAARPKRPRHALHRSPARPQHVILHRVLYASPLCDRRSSFINELIGLADNEYEVTQVPVAYVTPDVIDVAMVLPPTTPLRYTPIYPPGPGPIILPPVGPRAPPLVFPGVAPPVTLPVGPPITLPVTTTPVITTTVPEPTSWMTMLFGFALVGGLARRRRTATHRKA